MAFTNYTGNVSSAQALNYTVNIPVSGGASISGSRIDGVAATLGMSTNAYTNIYNVRVRLLDSNSNILAETSRSDIKFTSSNYGQAYFDFAFGTGFDVNAIKSIDVFGLSYASKIFVKGAQSVGISYTVRTATTSPGTVTLSKSEAEPSGAATLNWSGAGAGAANDITGYTIQRSDNGAAWSTWQTNKTSPFTVYAQSDYGKYYDYRIITQGQYIDSAPSVARKLTTLTPTAAGEPTSAYLDKTLAEDDPTLAFSGASGGTINAITSYEIQYAESYDNSAWGAWTALKTLTSTATADSTTVDLSSTRGNYRKYRIRTLGSAGAAYYSGYKETGSVRKNSLPTAPSYLTAAPVVFVSGTITLDYGGATDPDNNISTYNVQYAVKPSSGAYGNWVALADGVMSHTPTLEAGSLIKYRVRTVDALGAVSDFIESNACGKNTAPAAPTINYPQNNKTTFNSRPRFLVTLGNDPESHLLNIGADGYTATQSRNLEGGAKVALRKISNVAAGAVSISVIASDIYGESAPAANRNTTYQAPNWTDLLIPGITSIKAAHMTEIRTKINIIRAYYGLSPIVWAQEIEAGKTSMSGWAGHVQEIRTAINDVVSLIKQYDAGFSAPAWINIIGKQPQADVITQLRTVIETL